MWVFILLYTALFFGSYLLMSLRRKVLHLTYGHCDCDPTMAVSFIVPAIGIIFATAELAAYKLGLRAPGYYFSGERCTMPR